MFQYDPTQWWRRLSNSLAGFFVSVGGVAIILSVLAILVFIGVEALPLLWAPKVEQQSVSQHPFLGTEEYQQVGYALGPEGNLEFFSIEEGRSIQSYRHPQMGQSRVSSVWQDHYGTLLAFATDDGRVLPVLLSFHVSHQENAEESGAGAWTQDITPQVEPLDPVVLSQEGRSLAAAQYVHRGESSAAAVGIGSDGALLYFAKYEQKSLLAGKETKTQLLDLRSKLPAPPTMFALDPHLENLYVAVQGGKIAHFRLTKPGSPELAEIVPLREDGAQSEVTALEFLTGGNSLVVGESDGSVSVWFQVRETEDAPVRKFRRVHALESHEAAVSAISTSSRDRGFLTADRLGRVKLHHATSEQTFFTLQGDASPVTQLWMAPRANGIYAQHESGKVSRWALENPHPEINMAAIFDEVWYEGYDKPEAIWQSTGGSDDFEPKFSLVPLIFGTLKGTLYALLISLPLALLGAIYTSQFMHPSVRSYIKPTIEVMAALPSVVLGFLAGLWIAPRMEKLMPAVLAMLLVVPVFSFLSFFIWKLLPKNLTNRFRSGMQIFLLVPMIFLGLWLCVGMNEFLSQQLFSGDFQQWWYDSTGLRYDQRNALVIGFAMGFAVIPIIFTIAEDSLSNVPRHLISGSLALGANSWQTALHVVLPTASPGIFSAIMIGLGRAVGETMIVLMATGNTPITEWNIFNGFRTLSANIAVEIPEAPHGGTLYRVLFLSALLLFAFTFIVNTVAEVIRIRMRRKFANL